jgi:hypothetical protein
MVAWPRDARPARNCGGHQRHLYRGGRAVSGSKRRPCWPIEFWAWKPAGVRTRPFAKTLRSISRRGRVCRCDFIERKGLFASTSTLDPAQAWRASVEALRINYVWKLFDYFGGAPDVLSDWLRISEEFRAECPTVPPAIPAPRPAGSCAVETLCGAQNGRTSTQWPTPSKGRRASSPRNFRLERGRWRLCKSTARSRAEAPSVVRAR